MPRVSRLRKKRKEAAERIKEAKAAGKNSVVIEKEDRNDDEPIEIAAKTKPKSEKKKVQRKPVETRKQAKVKEANRKRTQACHEKLAELRQKAQERSKKRRENCANTHTKNKLRKLEAKNKELEEEIQLSANALASKQCEPSTSFFQPLLIITGDEPTSKSAPNTPTEIMKFQFPNAPPTPRLSAEASTRLKNSVGLSHRDYEKLRNEMAREGVSMPSQSTVQRKESQIFDEHYRNNDEPDFYGLIEKAVMKHDFSRVPNVRITLCGDGGGDGDKSSVKICCFFNDIPLPLSVKKLMIIWSYVGKETREKLKDVLKYIDLDVLKLIKNELMLVIANLYAYLLVSRAVPLFVDVLIA
uniref:BZIP domain-containing protein n=1 Tax=Panagrolaimus superbus TaxID=310955 RepID=A0A914XWX2_9BILA